ncbi:MAG: Gfo/Idh/MocA family oxidoreductase [Solirubrobacterales bacterium]|nr:Gfo/Idh/MocA family oxidoreductase [Solirubrobacterales bacterium]
MTRKHIALVGCGAWGSNILRDLRELGCDVTVVARSAASIERARVGGATAIVPTIGALPAVEGAVVATLATAHAEVCHELLDRGLSVFCEKPLTVDLAEARALDARADGRLFVMDKWRYHGGVEALRDLARSGELGHPVGLVTVREQWGSPHRDVDTVWVHVPHDLAIAFEILGPLGPVVGAVAERIEGRVAGLQGTLGRAPWVTISHSTAAPATRRMFRLVCEGGTATLADSHDEALLVASGVPERGSAPQPRPFDPEWPLRKELRAFLAHLDGGPAPRSSSACHLALLERLVDLRHAAGLDGRPPADVSR